MKDAQLQGAEIRIFVAECAQSSRGVEKMRTSHDERGGVGKMEDTKPRSPRVLQEVMRRKKNTQEGPNLDPDFNGRPSAGGTLRGRTRERQRQTRKNWFATGTRKREMVQGRGKGKAKKQMNQVIKKESRKQKTRNEQELTRSKRKSQRCVVAGGLDLSINPLRSTRAMGVCFGVTALSRGERVSFFALLFLWVFCTHKTTEWKTNRGRGKKGK